MAIAFGVGLIVAIVPMVGLSVFGNDADVGANGETGATDTAAPLPSKTPDIGEDPDSTTSAQPTPVDVPRTDQHDGGEAAQELSEVALGSCPTATVTVRDAEGLTEALGDASPGDVIVLADGVYEGEFRAAASGTSAKPIYLCGTPQAVLTGDGHKAGYVFHLDGAQYWRLLGFTVYNGQKGVMADGTVGTVIQGLTVHSIGDEAVHLRRFSTDNVVKGNTIFDTGNRREKFGEGVYIGTAESNWCDISNCEPDRSDRNVVEGNVIFDVTAEGVDIKEGTSGGTVRGNSFDGASLTKDGGDSWVDVKGNNWIIEGNVGINSSMDGFQVHEILDGWGKGNRFKGNTATVNGPGFGFSLTPVQDNVVECSNTVSSAKEGYANVSCR